jgi:hypothetical protein
MLDILFPLYRGNCRVVLLVIYQHLHAISLREAVSQTFAMLVNADQIVGDTSDNVPPGLLPRI